MSANDTSLDAASAVAPTLAAAIEPVIGGDLPVRLIAWDGSVAGSAGAPVVWLRSPAALRRMLWRPGELGAAQAYVRGDLDVDGDLVAALTVVWAQIAERQLSPTRTLPAALAHLGAVAARLGALGRPLPPLTVQARVRSRLHESSCEKAAIRHRYNLCPDPSNSFYRLILDPSMAYSCAYWKPSRPDSTLAQAQWDKLDRICHKLGLDDRPGMRLLDVGCGWGSLSLHAAEQFGARVVGITPFANQKAYIDAALTARGLADRVEIRVQDYRSIADGQYDAAAAIESGEHVGRQNYRTYARILHGCVRPGAPVLIQQMSRPGGHPGGGPFMESFVASDMHTRPLGQTIALLEEAGLSTIAVEAMRKHYVRTVDTWIGNLETHWEAAVSLIGEEGARAWRLHLATARVAFAQGRMGVDQILLSRPTKRPMPARA